MPELLKTPEPAGGEGRFQEQGHSFFPSGPTLAVNNRLILPFQFFTENIFKLKFLVQAIQFCTREI